MNESPEAKFHRTISRRLSRREQGYVMAAFREAIQVHHAALPQAERGPQDGGDVIAVVDLTQQLSVYADPDCRECDGSGVWMGNVLVCNCILNKLQAVAPQAVADDTAKLWTCKCGTVNPTFDPWCSACEEPQPKKDAQS